MNTQHPYDNHRPEQAARPEPRIEAANPAEMGVTPEAVQAATVARGQKERLEVDRPTRGVDWVRTSDLLARGTGAISRRSIDLEAKLGYGVRHGIAVGAKYVGRQTMQAARKLAPASAFGRDDQTVEPRGLGRA